MNENSRKTMKQLEHASGLITAEIEKITNAAGIPSDHPLGELIEVVISATSSLAYWKSEPDMKMRTPQETLEGVLGAMHNSIGAIRQIGEGLAELEYRPKESIAYVLEFGLKVAREDS